MGELFVVWTQKFAFRYKMPMDKQTDTKTTTPVFIAQCRSIPIKILALI